jgi:hypothetical protein
MPAKLCPKSTNCASCAEFEPLALAQVLSATGKKGGRPAGSMQHVPILSATVRFTCAWEEIRTSILSSKVFNPLLDQGYQHLLETFEGQRARRPGHAGPAGGVGGPLLCERFANFMMCKHVSCSWMVKTNECNEPEQQYKYKYAMSACSSCGFSGVSAHIEVQRGVVTISIMMSPLIYEVSKAGRRVLPVLSFGPFQDAAGVSSSDLVRVPLFVVSARCTLVQTWHELASKAGCNNIDEAWRCRAVEHRAADSPTNLPGAPGAPAGNQSFHLSHRPRSLFTSMSTSTLEHRVAAATGKLHEQFALLLRLRITSS